jgi:hypothetical protein
VLLTHRWPTAHAGSAPQRQAPVDEQLSARASHAAQVEPAFPQVASERVSHTVPWQQPLGHELASQVHSPEAQRCPPAHAGPDPHAQAPAALQPSALVASQAMQVRPSLPQVGTDGVLQVPPRQHPVGHDPASHTHAPFMQCWPGWQAALPPHRQAPVTEHVSALSASHALQATAPVPQVATERA